MSERSERSRARHRRDSPLLPCPGEVGPEMLVTSLFLAPALAGWVEVRSGRCETDHPDDHRLQLAQDSWDRRSGLGEVEAAVKARATDELLRGVCAGRDEAVCAQIRQRVGVESAVDLDARIVCAAAVVASEVVEDPAGLERYQQAVDALAARLDAHDSDAVWVAPARWASGCGAGDTGARLAADLRGSLAARGVEVREAADTRLVLVLTPGPRVGLEVRRVQADGATVVGSTSLSRAWLGLHDLDTERCVGDERLGLADGEREGAGGLSISLVLDGPSELCPGQRSKARVEPSRPAYVQVWSVGRSGHAWLAWSSRACEPTTPRKQRGCTFR